MCSCRFSHFQLTDDCNGNLKCVNNCGAPFPSVLEYDCCIDLIGTYSGPTSGSCGADDCNCSNDNKIQYIKNNGGNCQDITDTGCKIDPSIVLLNIPNTTQCETELNQLTVKDFLSNDETRLQLIRSISIADMRAGFKCMTYSFFRIGLGGECEPGLGNSLSARDTEECKSACIGRVAPIFAGRRPWQYWFLKFFDNYNELSSYFDYDIPINLPSREDRKFPRGESYGRFFFDNFNTLDRAAAFIVDVFDQFMGCAVSLDANAIVVFAH